MNKVFGNESLNRRKNKGSTTMISRSINLSHSRNLLNGCHWKKLEDTCYSRPRKSNPGNFDIFPFIRPPKSNSLFLVYELICMWLSMSTEFIKVPAKFVSQLHSLPYCKTAAT